MKDHPMIRSALALALSCLCSLLCFSGFAADQVLKESPANNKKILKLIAEVYDKPLDPATPDKLSVILKYSEAAEKILVSIKVGSLDLNDKHATLYMGFLVAGATKFDLENPKQANDKNGADQADIDRFLKRAYDKLKESDATYSSEFYSKLK